MKKKTVFTIILIAAAVGIRLGFFDYQTLDYQNFLAKWVQYFRQAGGFSALKNSIGNYNVPYLYFLAAFSYLPVDDLYLIKILSCVFDFILALAGMKTVRKCGASENASLACFFVILFLPTVVINGSLWAQCDSIYVAFGLLGIFLALDDKPVASMICMALSFGFKLQAVFILPVCIILLIMGKYRWWHFLIFPLSYLVLILPAVIAGRPLLSTITLYWDQMNTVGSAPNYNAPAFNAITHGEGSVTAAIIAMAVNILLAIILRKRLDNRTFILLAVITVTVIPYLLPHMHDRYFYAADVLSVVALFSMAGKLKIPVAAAAVCQQFASLICYLAYLTTRYIPLGHIYLTNDRGARAVLISLLIYVLTFVYILV